MKEVNPVESGVQLFSNYAANLAKAGSGNPAELKMLLDQFPYCQLLHLFYTHNLWSSGDPDYTKQLERAALFIPDRTSLAAILKAPRLKEDATEKEESILAESEVYTETSIPEKEAEDISELSLNQIQDSDSNDPQSVTDIEEIKAERAEEENKPEILNAETEDAPVAGFSAQGTEKNAQIAEEVIITAEAEQKVSKYNDDKMPYSFLWWLDKTRKEHSDTYQPYVEFKLDTTQKIKKTSVDQLSSQIIENIFHLQSPLDDIENGPKTVPFQVKHKEDTILEKFIKEEPQIRPPDSHKLDTENKAKKSAEDSNDLVSETLAQIYTDQMLFQKAIDTYKKLSLKFPEKSTYFAVQIRELEKKVN